MRGVDAWGWAGPTQMGCPGGHVAKTRGEKRWKRLAGSCGETNDKGGRSAVSRRLKEEPPGGEGVAGPRAGGAGKGGGFGSGTWEVTGPALGGWPGSDQRELLAPPPAGGPRVPCELTCPVSTCRELTRSLWHPEETPPEAGNTARGQSRAQRAGLGPWKLTPGRGREPRCHLVAGV